MSGADGAGRAGNTGRDGGGGAAEAFALAGPVAARVVLEADDRFFAGHFPDSPILPGVAQLALLERELSRIAGRPLALGALRKLRFRRPAFPGDALDLEASPRGAETTFVWRRAGEVVADGSARLVAASPLAADDAPRFAPATDGAPRFAPATGGAPECLRAATEAATGGAPEGFRAATGGVEASSLLPHRAPARFAARVLRADDERLDLEALVPEASAFVREGAAPALLALEIAAQAAACFETLVRVRAGGPGEARRGYLVGARDVVLDGGPLPAGRPVLAAVRLAACAPPLSRYAFEVGAGGRLRGEVSTFLAE
ncbi:MAG TPA: hypothetical protein PKG80_03195 [Acidobacteriota bacterium]|nr:hypothetical protein [Acidobacteriota bacterium]